MCDFLQTSYPDHAHKCFRSVLFFTFYPAPPLEGLGSLFVLHAMPCLPTGLLPCESLSLMIDECYCCIPSTELFPWQEPKKYLMSEWFNLVQISIPNIRSWQNLVSLNSLGGMLVFIPYQLLYWWDRHALGDRVGRCPGHRVYLSFLGLYCRGGAYNQDRPILFFFAFLYP